MGKTRFQKTKSGGIFGGAKNYTRTQMGRSGPSVITPERLPDGWQSTKLKIPMKIVSCAEFGCETFANDRVDPQTGKLIKAGTMPCGVPHKIWNGRPPIYGIQYSGSDTTIHYVTEDEFIYRLQEGVYAGLELIKRGDLFE